MLYLWRAEAILRRGLAGDRTDGDFIAGAGASVRHEHADTNGAMRMLRDHEDLSSAAAESGAVRHATGVAAIRGNDRSGAARIVGAGAGRWIVLARVPYTATHRRFSIAAGALLHVSHLIRRR